MQKGKFTFTEEQREMRASRYRKKEPSFVEMTSFVSHRMVLAADKGFSLFPFSFPSFFFKKK